MPQINNSEIPVNPSFVHNHASEIREVDFSPPDLEMIEINPFIHLQQWSSELQNVISVFKETVNPGKVKELVSEVSRSIIEIKESIKLKEIKNELLNNIIIKGYKK